ncbi:MULTISPECIES: hypothetical protein [unclassified Streptomyces]|uniref:hypothetical protein n=1 Tax=unclassified Streptomyces TaxID=2593676 RepID=UPI002DD88815|nr:hypothetical protein [Streptomyces sp. NBC_00243]WRZ22723.1 hypothetical protein OHT59_31700 [Streptomyces sp. NBC_00243]
MKVFDLVAARTVLREHQVVAAGRGWIPATTASSPDDHKGYCPGATPISIRVTGAIGSGFLPAPSSWDTAGQRSPSASTPTRPPSSMA